jgi:hypothetical protein
VTIPAVLFAGPRDGDRVQISEPFPAVLEFPDVATVPEYWPMTEPPRTFTAVRYLRQGVVTGGGVPVAAIFICECVNLRALP